MGRGGLEHPRSFPWETDISAEGGAELGALAGHPSDLDPDLAALIDAWPDLPEAVRAGISAMVGAAQKGVDRG